MSELKKEIDKLKELISSIESNAVKAKDFNTLYRAINLSLKAGGKTLLEIERSQCSSIIEITINNKKHTYDINDYNVINMVSKVIIE